MLYCGHVICDDCRVKRVRNEKGQNQEKFQCQLCHKDQMMVSDQVDKYIEIIKRSNEAGQKKQMLKQQRFYCKSHPDEIINYYCHESKEFLCHICVFDRDISKKTAIICQKHDLIEHSN